MLDMTADLRCQWQD